MSTIIQIPDSVYDYLTDPSIQSVVDHLLEQKDDKLQVELAWNEVRAFHEACLSAQKVKTDYILWLMDLWDAIWQQALDKQEVDFKHLTLREMKEEYDFEQLNRQTIWNEKTYWRWFSGQINGKFDFDARIQILHETNKVQLYFRVDDEEEEVIPKQVDWHTTQKEWKLMEIVKEGEGNYLITSQEILLNSKQLDLTQLMGLAEDLMTQTMIYLKQLKKT